MVTRRSLIGGMGAAFASAAVGRASLGGLPVSGRFRVGNPVRFAEALSEVYPLRLTQRPGGGAQITRR